MPRSLKKGPFVDAKLAERVERMNRSGERRPVKTWSRRSMIVPDFVGHSFSVYNGHKFITIFVSENMVGHRLGEFAPTRTFRAHGAHTEKATAKK